MTEEILSPTDLCLFCFPESQLRLTVKNDYSYTTVKPVWASPMRYPGQYLALLDGKGNEICLLQDPNTLDGRSLAAVQRVLRKRTLTAVVSAINAVMVEYGATYWNVETDRGCRDFVTVNLQETAHWLSEEHLLLCDVDGNRFEIQDAATLDSRSRALLAKAL